MSSKPQKIADKLFVGIMILMFFALASLGSLLIHQRLRDHRDQLEQRILLSVGFLEETLPGAVASLNAKQIRRRLELSAAPELNVVEIFDDRGERIYVYERPESKGSVYDRKIERALLSDGALVGKMTAYFSVAGTLADLRLREFLRLAVLIAAVGIILGVGLYLLARKIILYPIRRTLDFSRALAGGNYRERIAVTASDEMGLLQKSLNQMAAALHRLVETLKKTVHDAELARAEAQEASKLKGEFLANMSHEIRTPLNAILGFTELLLEKEKEAGKIRDLNTIRNSAVVLLENINDILDFSKLEPGKLSLALAPFDPRQLLEEIGHIIQIRLQKKNVRFATEVQEEVPATIRSDRNRLRQILLNLLVNAAKFTEEGEIGLRISKIPDGRKLLFHVRDTGIGIPPEHHRSIFEPFIQVDSSHTREHGGTGLGLAITQKLVELLGGRIWLASEPGNTNFYFDLPI